ncbi:MAG: tRNA (adenosine(37)-N6)-threonylcarbamoyltransferase complex ATPase subunit type 1 TsaE [Planctomycetota bacterium]
MLSIVLSSLEETSEFACFVYRYLEEKKVIALTGSMGTGKTHFTKALFQAMGGNPEEVCSPTYTYLMIHHIGLKKLYHMDLYRLEGESDFYDIGGGDLLNQEEGLLVIEWANRLSQPLANTLEIEFCYLGENKREAHIQNPTPSMKAHF